MGFFQNTCKPEGLGGKLMVNIMNAGHAEISEWGISLLPQDDFAQVMDIGCGGGANVKRLLERYINAHVTGVDYSKVSVQKSCSFNDKAIKSGRCTVQ